MNQGFIPGDSYDANEQGFNRRHWEDFGNMPLVHRGSVPMLRADGEPPHTLEQKHLFRLKTFCLWNQADVDQLEEIFARISRGQAMLRYDERQYVPEHQNWIMLVSWAELFVGTPENAPIVNLSDNESGGHWQRIYSGV